MMPCSLRLHLSKLVFMVILCISCGYNPPPVGTSSIDMARPISAAKFVIAWKIVENSNNPENAPILSCFVTNVAYIGFAYKNTTTNIGDAVQYPCQPYGKIESPLLSNGRYSLAAAALDINSNPLTSGVREFDLAGSNVDLGTAYFQFNRF